MKFMNRAANLIGLNRIDVQDVIPSGSGGMGMFGHISMGFSQGLLLRRFRCPDCGCIIRMKPKGYFRRFQAPIHTIRSCLIRHISGKKWHDALSKSRQRHWLSALKTQKPRRILA